jgi:Tfp pilus assembly protein PilF
MSQWEDAQEQLEIILEKNPNFTSARLRLGVVLHRQGDAEGARREWERCVTEDPRDMRAKAYLAAVGGGDTAPAS